MRGRGERIRYECVELAKLQHLKGMEEKGERVSIGRGERV